MNKVLATLQNQHSSQVACAQQNLTIRPTGVQHNTLYTCKTQDKLPVHNMIHCARPYTYKTRDRSPVHYTIHCIPTRPETGRRCTTQYTVYTPTRPETGRRCTTQYTVHLQDPRQVAGVQHNTLYTTTSNTCSYISLESAMTISCICS